MGTATASSASASRSAGRPQASLPKSHAVGSPSRAADWRSSSVRRAPPSAASTRSPAARSAGTDSATPAPTTTGRWNRLPADARTHLLLYGSTEAPENTTPPAPAASAVRSTVPALPGSRTLARITTSRGRAASSRASGTSTKRHTARRPCGVTVWASSAITSPLTVCTLAPPRAAWAASSAQRSRTGAVTNSSVMAAPELSASPTACGPSARNERARCRKARFASCRAALTRGERALVISGPASAAMPGPPAALRAAARSGRGRARRLAELGQRLPGHVHERGERRRVGDGQVSEHPPVHVNARDLESLDKPVVGHAVGAGRGIDALDPQPPERALAVLAVAVRIGHRVERLLLGLAVQPGPLAPVAAGPLEDDPALLVSVNCPLYACHFFDSLKRA